MIALLAIVAVAWIITLGVILSGTGLMTRRAPKGATPARHSARSAGRTILIEDSPFDLESYAGGGSDWYPPGASGVDLGGES